MSKKLMRAPNRRRRLPWLLSGLLCAALAASTAPVHADEIDDRVADLSTQLQPSKTEKERIAAVTALGRLGDRKTMKALVGALRDKSATVRAVAAMSLGKLGHRAALPALREACNDGDALVKKRAKDAVDTISEANEIEPDYGATSIGSTTRPGFGSNPRALAPRPELYVVVKAASDDSPKTVKYDKKARKSHADIAKLAMAAALHDVPTVTSAGKDAARFGLDCRNIDVMITNLETRTAGSYIEVEASLRLAISDDRGKMLSFMTGGAKVQVRKSSFDTAYLPELRREAIENAVKGLFDKLIAHLRSGAGA